MGVSDSACSAIWPKRKDLNVSETQRSRYFANFVLKPIFDAEVVDRTRHRIFRARVGSVCKRETEVCGAPCAPRCASLAVVGKKKRSIKTIPDFDCNQSKFPQNDCSLRPISQHGPIYVAALCMFSLAGASVCSASRLGSNCAQLIAVDLTMHCHQPTLLSNALGPRLFHWLRELLRGKFR